MRLYWIWFAHRPGVSDRLKAELLNHFQGPEDIFFGDDASFDHLPGISQEAKASLQNKDLTAARTILARCSREQIHILTYRDAAYPSRMRLLPDPPMVLYYRGTLPDLEEEPVIGIVGTRKASGYGLKCARQMGWQIAQCGGIVVSGMARGIDTEAMSAALGAGAPAVGILGCGVDRVYPPENGALFRDTAEKGCILSEYPPGTPPNKWHFPKRNRLIAAISRGLLVVEAPEGSGALITADHAFQLGREVFAVPGNIDHPGFVGSNRLLREGATAVTTGWEVIGEYRDVCPGRIRYAELPLPEEPTPEPAPIPREKPKKKKKTPEPPIDKGPSGEYSDANKPTGLSDEEQRLYDALAHREWLMDDLATETGIPATRLLTALTTLRLRGLAKQLPGNRIART